MGAKANTKGWTNCTLPVCPRTCTPTRHTGTCARRKKGREGGRGGREGRRMGSRKLCLPFLMVKDTDPLLRVALKRAANAVRKAVGLRTPMLDDLCSILLAGAVVLCSMMERAWWGGEKRDRKQAGRGPRCDGGAACGREMWLLRLCVLVCVVLWSLSQPQQRQTIITAITLPASLAEEIASACSSVCTTLT